MNLYDEDGEREDALAGCEVAAVALALRRDGVLGVLLRGLRGPLTLRTDERNGAGFALTCRLAGRRRDRESFPAVTGLMGKGAGAEVGVGNRESFTDDVRRGRRRVGEHSVLCFNVGESFSTT